MNDEFSFILLSDPQLGMMDQGKVFAKALSNFEQAIIQAEQYDPAFVIVCGDMVDDPADSDSIFKIKTTANNLNENIPLYWIPGNHDIGNHPTAARLNYYRQNFGDDFYSFNINKTYFLALNSTTLCTGETGEKEYDQQTEFIRSELSKTHQNNYENIIVFSHHPFFLEYPEEPGEYWTYPLKKRIPLLDLFHDAGVNAVFSGHCHQRYSAKYKGMQLITTGPVGFPLNDEKSGFAVVKVTLEKIEYNYIGIE